MTILRTNAQAQTMENENKREVSDYLKDTLVNKATVIEPGTGESLSVLGSTMTFKLTTASTNNQLGLYEITLAPQVSGAKLHYHRFMDETFVVIQGTLTIQLLDREEELAKGMLHFIATDPSVGFMELDRALSPSKEPEAKTVPKKVNKPASVISLVRQPSPAESSDGQIEQQAKAL